MKATKAVHVSARNLDDTVLIAMSIAQATTETAGLMKMLFANKEPPSEAPKTTEEEKGKLVEWLIKTFPHHVLNASPDVLRFGLNQSQIQLLHYRLSMIPERLEHLLKEIGDKYPRDVPASDVVALLPAHCGLRLGSLVGYMHIHLCVCWSMVFDD